MFVFSYMDRIYGDGAPSVFIKLINSDSELKMLVWGIMEQATGYVLIYILPMLLAMKFRTEHELATMGGTIIGTLTAMSYMIAKVCFGLFAELGLTGRKPGDPGENMRINNEIRLFRIILVIISNIFFIEWAYDDYLSLRLRSKKATWC